MLIGRKGKEVKPGLIYVPYLMAQSIYIEDKNIYRKNKIRNILGLPSTNFKPSKTITSRYATQIVNKKFYGTININ